MATCPPSNQDLSLRLRQIRVEVFGDGPSGIRALADEIGLPPQTWKNFESGVGIPGPILLGFIMRTRASPEWLMSGRGESRLSTKPIITPFPENSGPRLIGG